MPIRPPYYRLPAAALENVHLTRAALIVLAVIIDQSDFGPPELTIEEIAELAEVAPRTVRDCLTQLKAAGLLEVQRTGRASRYEVREILPPKRRARQQQPAQRQSKTSSIDMSLVDQIMKGDYGHVGTN